MSEAAKFCDSWNARHKLKITPTRPQYQLLIDEHWIRLLKTQKIYINMTAVWRELWKQTSSLAVDYKQQLALFLEARAKIRAFGAELSQSVLDQTWCLYHCKTPMYPKEHTELGIITNAQARRPMRGVTPNIGIMAELLTVIDPADIPKGLHLYSGEARIIDQESSEIEWRKGLAYGRQ